jgi:hypothetical protein
VTPARRLAGTLLAAGLLVPLAGCGGGVDAYCGDLRSHQKEMAAMIDSSSPSAMLDHRSMLHDLADKAPEDLKDEWQLFNGALDDLDQAIADAGVKASDFADGKPPAGLSASEQKAIAEAADRISSDDVVAAANGIEQQGRDVCKVNLGLG